MFVGKQMILAIFIIAIALRAEPELQIRIIQLRPAAYRTAMFGDHCICTSFGILRLCARAALLTSRISMRLIDLLLKFPLAPQIF